MPCVQRAVNPDSGWSWVLCFSAVISVLVVIGFPISFGVFNPYLMEYFGENKERTAWIGSIIMGLILFSGTFAVFLTDRLGYRTVNMACGFICFASLMASSFVNQLMILYFSLSVVYGIAAGMMLNIALTETKIHFRKYFALASGIVVSGNSIGMLILSQVNELLLEALGWRNTFRIMSGLVLLVSFTSITYDPRVSSQRQEVIVDFETVRLHLQDQIDNDDTLEQLEHIQTGTKEEMVIPEDISNRDIQQDDNNDDVVEEIGQGEALLVDKSNHTATNTKDIVSEEGIYSVEDTLDRKTKGQQNCRPRKTTMKDVLSLFKNGDLVLGLVSIATVCVGLFVPQIHLMQFAVDLGISYRKSAQLYMYIAFASIISRIVSPHLASKAKKLSPLSWLQIAEFLCGTTVVLLSLGKTYGHLVGLCIAHGLTNGAVVSINILFVTSMVEPAKSGLVVGVDHMLCAVPIIGGPPLAGELMQKLIECFDDLAQNKIIGKVTTTRKYRMRNDERTSSRFSEEEKQEKRSERGKHHVVRASFSYYGGIPLKKHRKVTFASVPNSVYVPPIRHALPIIKHTDSTGISSKEEALSRLSTLYSPHFPRLHWDTDDEPQANDDADEWFISPVPEDLANRCMKAAHDFIIVKEQFTDSETWRTVTSLTFSRKERKWRVSRIIEAMPSFYTAVDFPMYGYALERRPFINKAEGIMAIDTIQVTKKYTIATSRNPQNKRTVTRKETMKRGASKNKK